MAKTNVQVIFVVGVTRWGKQSVRETERKREERERRSTTKVQGWWLEL